MFYRCTHCDQPFESTAARPRCPRCLRITTVVSLGAPPEVVTSVSRARPGRRRGGHQKAHVQGPPRARPPVSVVVWLGMALLGADGLAYAGTDMGRMAGQERVAAAATFAALAGAGFGLVAWGLWRWLRGRS